MQPIWGLSGFGFGQTLSPDVKKLPKIAEVWDSETSTR
jgi:hypothetical protein